MPITGDSRQRLHGTTTNSASRGTSATANLTTNTTLSTDNTSEDDEEPDSKVIETDPTGRFERYATTLGTGAYKQVFKAFDQEEGVEVAWNQLRIDHISKRDIPRILSEIRILESLVNDNIIVRFLFRLFWRAPLSLTHYHDDRTFSIHGLQKDPMEKTRSTLSQS